ncbi:hypothetical protein [Thiobacillus sp.]|uniref:hypothetical protein n=1 Tax=Thiobacillus sp. TaxID=924 RepID=UPI0025D531B4|nr:hypothetical protein [Thiobacillus sp.]
MFAVLESVGRELPGGKSLSFASPKESNPRKGDPDIPEFPKIKRVGWAAKNSPRLAVFNLFFCRRGSNTFAADPPATLDLRRGCKGKDVKTSLAMSYRRGLGLSVSQ